MSDQDQDQGRDQDQPVADDSVFEANLSGLMQRAHEPPRMADSSRLRVLAALKTHQTATVVETASASTRYWRPLAVAVAIAASIALWWMLPHQGQDGADGQRIVYTNTGTQPSEVTLADGSRVVLRAETVFEELGPRHLKLVRGEAVFEVAKADTPFVVETEHGRATALGTRFLVRSGVAETFAAVLRGTVRLEGDAGNETLRAGQAGVVANGNATLHATGRLSVEVAWARELLSDLSDVPQPARRGNLLARNPRWQGEWPLPMRKLKVDVYVDNGIARTTIDQTFFNAIPQQLEGVYSFPLPANAALSRLGMYVDGTLMEAGIVERQRGRDVYEGIVHQRRDPALLEWMEGNAFRVRIFPLPPRTEKRIVLSYTEALPELYGNYKLRVPIPEIDLPVGEFEVAVHVENGAKWELVSANHALSDTLEDGVRVGRLSQQDVEIGADLALQLRRRDQDIEPVRMVAAGEQDTRYLMVRARPTLPSTTDYTKRRWVALYDTSASRTVAQMRAQAVFLARFLDEIDENDRFELVAFDASARPWSGQLQDVDSLDRTALVDFLQQEGRGRAGETDLHGALEVALGLLDNDTSPASDIADAGAPHILLLGDGLATADGPQSLSQLRSLLGRRATFVAASIGANTDALVLGGLAESSGGLSVQLDASEDLGWRALDLVATLNTARVHGLRAEFLAADGTVLQGLNVHASGRNLAHGETLTLLARTPQTPSSLRLRGVQAGEAWTQTLSLTLDTGEARYLPRLWARARIASLQADGLETHRDEITRLGMENFLVTPTTSLLVLENEAMYRQYKVTRPDKHTWARYPAPASIDVVREPMGAGVSIPAGTRIVRSPLKLLGKSTSTSGIGTIGVGGLGLIGTGAGGGGATGILSVLEDGEFLTHPFSAAFAVDNDSEDVWGGAGAAGPVAEAQGWVTTDALSRTSLFKVGRTTRASLRMKRKGRSTGRAESRRPVALAQFTDPRLSDLTEHLSGMFDDAFDVQREVLRIAAVDRPAGQLDADARAWIDKARAAAPVGRFELPNGTQLNLARSGRFRAVTADSASEEHIVYDGSQLSTSYPELELRVHHDVGPAAFALLLQWAPWLLPDADELARWYEITRTSDRELTLSVPDTPASAATNTVLTLDAEGRLASITQSTAGHSPRTLKFVYRDDAIEVVDGTRRRTIVWLAATPGPLTPPFDDAAWGGVELPLRSAKDLEAELVGLSPGSAAWIRNHRQRIASLVAVHQAYAAAPVLDALVAQGVVTRGDLALASGATRWVAATTWSRVVKKFGRDDPMVAFLGISRGAGYGRRAAREYQKLSKRHPGTLVGMLAGFRGALWVDWSRPKRSIAAVDAFVSDYDAPTLAFVATYQLAQQLWAKPTQAGALWTRLAARFPKFRVRALYSAGVAAYTRGGYPAAAKAFVAMFEAGTKLKVAPIVDEVVRTAFRYSPADAAAWGVQWGRWRSAVVREGDSAMTLAFLEAAYALGEPGDAARVLRAVKPANVTAEEAVAFADVLSSDSSAAGAKRILLPLLERFPNDPRLQLRASELAQQQGRLNDAAEHMERLFETQACKQLELADRRAMYRRWFELEASVVQATGSDHNDAYDRMLMVVAKWRDDDPDNAEVDEGTAKVFYANGQPRRAWRQLSSIIERHPAEGSAHAQVAIMLEREVLLEQADLVWARAVKAEPTNPTWLLRRAQNRLAFGDRNDADELLSQIAAGKWQPRFQSVVTQATTLKHAQQ